MKGQKCHPPIKRIKMTDYNRKDSMLKTNAVAQALNIHENTVRRWSDHGLLKVFRIGPRGDRRFKRKDIDSFRARSLPLLKRAMR